MAALPAGHAPEVRRCEIAIIGGGTAGMAAHDAACRHTDDVLVIDDRGWGTSCARVACMPSKLLIAAADAARHARQAAGRGVRVDGLRIDGAAVLRHVRHERDRFVRGVLDEVSRWPAHQRLQGRARFVEPRVLEVDGHTRVHARRIVIATGSRPSVPAGWQDALGDRLALSDDVFDWPDLPPSLVVAGAGAVGLELSQALARLGVRVRLLGADGVVGPLADRALRDALVQALSDELAIEPDAGPLDPACTPGGARLRPGDAPSARVLAATGRRPALDDLQLERAGIALDDDGRPRIDPHTGQVGRLPIFMAGDADGRHEVLHTAAEDGAIAGHQAACWPDLPRPTRQVPMALVFTDPQVAVVGPGTAALTRDDVPFVVGRASFAHQGRARILGQTCGAVQVHVHAVDARLLGAEIVGPQAEHLAHLVAWAVQRGDVLDTLLAMPCYHPSVEEALRNALANARRARQAHRAGGVDHDHRTGTC